MPLPQTCQQQVDCSATPRAVQNHTHDRFVLSSKAFMSTPVMMSTNQHLSQMRAARSIKCVFKEQHASTGRCGCQPRQLECIIITTIRLLLRSLFLKMFQPIQATKLVSQCDTVLLGAIQNRQCISLCNCCQHKCVMSRTAMQKQVLTPYPNSTSSANGRIPWATGKTSCNSKSVPD